MYMYCTLHVHVHEVQNLKAIPAKLRDSRKYIVVVARIANVVVPSVHNMDDILYYVVLGGMGVHVCNVEYEGVHKSGVDSYKCIWTCIWVLHDICNIYISV